MGTRGVNQRFTSVVMLLKEALVRRRICCNHVAPDLCLPHQYGIHEVVSHMVVLVTKLRSSLNRSLRRRPQGPAGGLIELFSDAPRHRAAPSGDVLTELDLVAGRGS